MGSFREKSQGFIVGILVGLIVAGGFFIFKLDDYFKELSFYKSVSNTFSSESKNEAKVEHEVEAPKDNRIKKKAISPPVTDEEIVEENKTQADTGKIVKDSLTLENPNSDEVVVRKDELISTKTVEVINLDPVAKMTGKDSLLQKVSGIKDDRSSSKQYMNLEFWTSPLNYKGYKMSKYKLILYGISSPEGMKLFKLDEVIYLRNSALVYRFDPSGEFKPYERITDETVISRLK